MCCVLAVNKSQISEANDVEMARQTVTTNDVLITEDD